MHAFLLVTELKLLHLIFYVLDLQIAFFFLNVKTRSTLAQGWLYLIKLLSLCAIGLSSWNIFIWLVIHEFMLLNLFKIIHHIRPILIILWLFITILSLKITNMTELVFHNSRNLPVGLHWIEMKHIIVDYILTFRYWIRLTTFWRLRWRPRVVTWRARAWRARGTLGWWRIALTII